MTYKEIEREILRLVGVLDENADDSCYADYREMIPGGIKRALSDIEARKLLPIAYTDIDSDTCLKSGGNFVYSIPDLTGVFSPYKLSYLSGFSDECLDFSFDDDKTLVFENAGDGIYRLSFYPKISHIKIGRADNLPVPDYIASAIPYFVAGDIYMGDEPALASVFRQKYELALSRIEGERDGRRGCVKSPYRIS